MLQKCPETFGRQSQNLPLPALFLHYSDSQNFEVTHHPETHDARETGLMIYIDSKVHRYVPGYAKMCV